MRTIVLTILPLFLTGCCLTGVTEESSTQTTSAQTVEQVTHTAISEESFEFDYSDEEKAAGEGAGIGRCMDAERAWRVERGMSIHYQSECIGSWNRQPPLRSPNNGQQNARQGGG